MITEATNSEGKKVLAMAFSSVYNEEAVEGLRDALFGVIELITSNKETKDDVDPYHMYLLVTCCHELTKDVENFIREGGRV